MVRRNEARYIQFYTDGSGARQVEPKPCPKAPAQPSRPHREKKMLIRVDFMAVSGILVAAVMLLLMVVGVSSLKNANQEVVYMEAYVAELQAENERLQQTYRASYDLESVRQAALKMGMVPEAEAETVLISAEEPMAQEPEQSVWGHVWSFLTGLFA